MVVASDVEHIITDLATQNAYPFSQLGEEAKGSTTARLLTPLPESDDGVVLTPDSSQSMVSAQLTPILTPYSSASSLLRCSTVGTPLTCPLCPVGRRFSSVMARWQHLNSPAHSPLRFHCPVALVLKRAQDEVQDGDVAQRSFSTLSGVAQHLESGACKGGMANLKAGIGYIEQRLKLLGLEPTKLLGEALT